MSHNVIIIQRVVPHYRFALFERLWREFGWHVPRPTQFLKSAASSSTG